MQLTAAARREVVEEIDSEAINKGKLKRLLKNLYVEACEVE